MWFLKSLSELQWNCPEESLNLYLWALCLYSVQCFLHIAVKILSCFYAETLKPFNGYLMLPKKKKKKASDKICKFLHSSFRKDYFGDRKKDVVFLFKLKIIYLFKYDLYSVLWTRVRDVCFEAGGLLSEQGRSGCYNRVDNAKA